MTFAPHLWMAVAGLLVAPPQIGSLEGRPVIHLAQNYGGLAVVMGGRKSPIAASNWSTVFVLWRLEEATGGPWANTGGVGNSTENLDENSGTTISQTTTAGEFNEGSAAADFDGGGANEWIECTDANCGDQLDIAGTASWGIRFRPDSVAFKYLMGKDDLTNGWYAATTGTSLLRCAIDVAASVPLDTTSATYSGGTYYSAACVFDDSGNTIEAFLDAQSNGSTAATGTPAGNSIVFSVGSDNSDVTFEFAGQLDEAWVIDNVVLTASEVEYIHHCDVRGVRCSCDPEAASSFASCSVDQDCQSAAAPTATCHAASGTCYGRAGTTTNKGACNAANPS